MFRLLGFEVKIGMGFILFSALIVFIYPGSFGLWLAGSLAAFTLIHELGHALVARSTGAQASISLGFMAGYTSFRPSHPLSTRQQMAISLAGPLTQIVASLIILVAMGVNPLSPDSLQSIPALAIWWSGLIIGALNLIPVLPLDGGHLVLALIEPLTKERSMRIMAIASMVITIGTAVVLVITRHNDLSVFLVFLLISQIQILQSTGQRPATTFAKTVADEREAWVSHSPRIDSRALSPWYRAHQAVRSGDPNTAARLILADLRRPDRPRWVLPPEASPDALAEIVEALPDDLPVGNPMSSQVLATVLLRCGQTRRGGEYAASIFEVYPRSSISLLVAVAAATLGEDENAISWLEATASIASHDSEISRDALRAAIDHTPAFERFRDRSDYRQIRSQI
ncbi:MAG: hypothetical protein CSA55_04260 [Ilumatobacter coccineus]|uniref:Peptidase M50 domain-containing protein n=1 Tax=Ilumatobacter coccineus TaxID=467094 RepID=A0A2G6K8N2_9ACTN|nr:MAG: hypothetical protein CSA55_04260 [Ilumatobacter coccineus]